MATRRINSSVLGALERPALAWMAQRLPAWVTPDRLTAFGIAGSLLTAAGYVASRGSLKYLWLACLGLVMNWAGDSLDGTLARLRRIERPRYGFFIDHTSDLFMQSAVFLALGVSPCARFGVACLGLIAFLMTFVYTLIHAHVRGAMRITYFGFGPTEIRALLLLGNLITLAAGVIDLGAWVGALRPLGPVTIFDAVIVVIASATVLALGAIAFAERRQLSKEDPPPKR